MPTLATVGVLGEIRLIFFLRLIETSLILVGAKDGQDCSPENILQEIKVEVNGIENGGTPHSGDSLSPSSLLSPSIGKPCGYDSL